MLAPELIYSFRSLKVLRMLTRNLRCRTDAERSNRSSGNDSVNLVRYLRDLLSVVVVVIGPRYHIGGHDAFQSASLTTCPRRFVRLLLNPPISGDIDPESGYCAQTLATTLQLNLAWA